MCMPEQRRRVSAQFEVRPCRWQLGPGRPVAEVAGDLGINAGTLANWVNAWRRGV
ncbi:transposase [Saccharopolyspora mangrovi]|uniref:Transposase n=1 Tax=Saccharopolyspora mangrovi TaxID=3082379 RepID=A0ABU6AHH8_9PSEU|nr:transposase [Saccharopolyspora sp. S2-29]MEB3370922.1 transposase [Saccharopolyspora sp. S2-29]